MTMNAMTWLVGLDLRPEAEGALAFATWLASAVKEDKVVPCHVLVADHLQAVLQHHHLAEVKDAARVAMNEEISHHDLEGHLADPILVEGGTAEGRLEIVREELGAQVVVINRFASESRRSLRRLGRVARRTLRELNSPVITCPPGLNADKVGKGPVVMCSNMTEECETALEFAADVAKRTGRKLIVTTVRRTPDEQVGHYFRDDSKEKITSTRREETESELNAWIEETGFQPDEQVALLGEVVSNVERFAEERDACLIVAGSRRLSKIERFFLTSVGRGLSATAPTPVAIIPPKAEG